MNRARTTTVRALAASCLLLVALSAPAGERHEEIPAAFQALLAQSMEQKFGVYFFIKGQVIAGVVTKINDDRTVEARSQQYDRILIRLDRVEAMARQ